MANADLNLECPACRGVLRPRLLVCNECGTRVEGSFALNEFASLPPEDLHFLRIFVRSEGRVREMESALGLSYPTIRSRIAALKERTLGSEVSAEETESITLERTRILERLEKGEIDFNEAIRGIKQQKRK